MSKNDVKQESVTEEVTTTVVTQEEFAKRYQKLCDEAGWHIVGIPQWRQSQDTGDFRLVIVLALQELPKPVQK